MYQIPDSINLISYLIQNYKQALVQTRLKPHNPRLSVGGIQSTNQTTFKSLTITKVEWQAIDLFATKAIYYGAWPFDLFDNE